jgi:hypothetical protein
MAGSIRLAPCIPHWLAAEREAAMHIDPDFMNCVGFIGAPSAHGFTADGTCFIFGIEEENERFNYLVTARHLVRPTHFREEVHSLDDFVYIRLPRVDGKAHVVKMMRGQWTPHSDRHVDICITEFDQIGLDERNELLMASLLYPGIGMNEEEITEYGFGVGSDLFIPSVFAGHVGEAFNIPIIRRASVAALPLTPIRVGSPTKPAFLIETHSLGGTSGAPVFFHLDPYKSSAREPASHRQWDQSVRVAPYKLIGMLIGSHSGNYLADFVSTDEAGSIIAKDADFNAGISVVLPLQLILEIINNSDIKARRDASLEAIKKQSGYRSC